jgi:drug/metabolite transporter (DMT)-like permease
MLYLLLAIGCSASIALIFRVSETRDMNRYAVTTANYVTACITAVATLVVDGRSLPSIGGIIDSLPQLAGAVAGRADLLTGSASQAWAVCVGLVAGVFFFLAFVYYQISVRNHGVSLPGAFAKLGILVPMSLSLVLWQEMPRTIQWLGIALAVGSIVLVNRPADRLRRGLKASLLLLFAFGGLAEFSNKVFQRHGLLEDKAIFLLMTFFVAFVLSLVVTVRKGLPVRRRDILTGVAVGLPNLFSSYFLIEALDRIPAAAVFPAYGAGTILVITLFGAVFMGERLTGRDRAVVALAVLSIVLINLRV